MFASLTSMPRSLHRWTTLVGTGSIDNLRSLRFVALIEWWDPRASTTFISWMLVSNVSVLVPNPCTATLVRRTPGNPASSTNFAATKEACAPKSKNARVRNFLPFSPMICTAAVIRSTFVGVCVSARDEIMCTMIFYSPSTSRCRRV